MKRDPLLNTRNYLRAVARKRRRAERPDLRHVVRGRAQAVPAATCPVRGCTWVGSPHRDGRASKRHVLANHPKARVTKDLMARINGAEEYGRISAQEATALRAWARKGRRRRIPL